MSFPPANSKPKPKPQADGFSSAFDEAAESVTPKIGTITPPSTQTNATSGNDFSKAFDQAAATVKKKDDNGGESESGTPSITPTAPTPTSNAKVQPDGSIITGDNQATSDIFNTPLGRQAVKAAPTVVTPDGAELQLKNPTPLGNSPEGIASIQQRISNKTATPQDIQLLADATGKSFAATKAYVMQGSRMGASVENNENVAKTQSQIAGYVNTYNKINGTNFDASDVMSSADKLNSFLTLARVNRINPDQQRGANYNVSASTRVNTNFRPVTTPLPATVSNDMVNQVVQKTVSEDQAAGVPKDETISKIAQRLNPYDYKKIQEMQNSKRLQLFPGSSMYSAPFIQTPEEETDLLNYQRGIADLKYNDALRQNGINKISQGTVSGNQQLVQSGQQDLNNVDDNVIYNYPSLIKKQIADQVNDYIAKQSGVVQGYENQPGHGMEMFLGASTNDRLRAMQELGILDDPRTKDIALSMAGNSTYFANNSLFGGIVPSFLQPFGDLGMSVADIVVLRNSKDIYTDKLRDRIFQKDFSANDDNDPDVLHLKNGVAITRNILNTTANLAGMLAISTATEGVAGAVLGTSADIGEMSEAEIAANAKKIATGQQLGAYTSFGLPGFDRSLKEAPESITNTPARYLYAAINAVAMAEGGRLLDLGKITRLPTDEAFAKIANGISDQSITEDATKQLLKSNMSKYVDFAVKYGKNVTKGAATMAYFNIADNVLKMAFGDPNTTTESTMRQGGQAFVDGLLGMSIMGVFGAKADMREEENTSYKGNIYNLALNHDATADILKMGLEDGTYTKPQYDEKMQILNTARAQKIALDATSRETGIDLTQDQKAVYVANKTAQAVFQKKADTPGISAEEKSKWENQAKQLGIQSTQVLDGLKFTPFLQPLQNLYDAEKVYNEAKENFNPDDPASESALLKAKGIYEKFYTDYLNGKSDSQSKINQNGKEKSNDQKAQKISQENADGKENDAGQENGDDATRDAGGNAGRHGDVTKKGVVTDEETAPLIKSYRERTGITEDQISDQDLLKNIAEQAQNIQAGKISEHGVGKEQMLYDQTVKQVGDKDLVDAAKKSFPAKELLKENIQSPINKDVTADDRILELAKKDKKAKTFIENRSKVTGQSEIDVAKEYLQGFQSITGNYENRWEEVKSQGEKSIQSPINKDDDLLYHGTDKEFDKFQTTVKKGVEDAKTEQPISLSPSKTFAQTKGKNLINVKIKKGTKIFDYENESDANKLVKAVEDGEIKLPPFLKEKSPTEYLKDGDWIFLESKPVKEWLKNNGYDGHYMKEMPEHDFKNVNIFNPENIEIQSPINTNEGTDKNSQPVKPEPKIAKGKLGEVETSVKAANSIKIGELIDSPISYKGEPARLYQDGQSVVAKLTGENKEFELGNIDEIKNHPISDYGIEHETSVVKVDDEGNFTVRGEKYVNPFEKREGQSPLEAITADKDGNVISVRLKTEDGKRRTFRGNIAEDLAYQIHLKEINKSNETITEFEHFINSDEDARKEIDNAGLPEITEEKPTENNEPVSREKVEPIKKIEVKSAEPQKLKSDETETTKTTETKKGQPEETETGKGEKTEPSDATTEEGEGVGVSHAARKERAEKLGEPGPERGEGISPAESVAHGQHLLAEGADPNKVAEDFKKSGKISADDIAIVRARHDELAKETNQAAEKFGIDSKEDKAAKAKETAFYDDVVKPMETVWHKIGVGLQGRVDVDTGTFVGIRRAFEQENDGKEMTQTQAKEAKELSGKVKSLQDQVADLQKKISEGFDKAVAEKEKEKKATFTEKAKTLADSFRKLKTKPFTFKDSNGNEIEIQKMGIGWNEIVELGAKAIEKTGEIADGIAKVIDNIKETDWYKNFSDTDKERFSKQLEEHYMDALPSKEEKLAAARIKALEKELADLKADIVKERAAKREPTDEEKDLKKQIAAEKERLGLLPEKSEKKTAAEKNIDRLQKQLDKLREGEIPEKSEKREPTDKEKELQDQIRKEKENLGLVKPRPEPKKVLTEQEKFEELTSRFVGKKDNKFDPKDAKDIWEYAKSEYLDQGKTFKDMLAGVSVDLGLNPDQVRHAIETPKGNKELSDEMYYRQNQRNKAIMRAKLFVKTANTPRIVKYLKAIPAFFFEKAIFGHGTVGMVTHAGANLFRPSGWKNYFPNFIRQFKYAFGGLTKTGLAAYEKEMEDLTLRKNFILAKRSGLANDPESVYDDYQAVKKFLGKLGMVGDRGFNALKVYRQDLFDAIYDKASNAEKADPEYAKTIAQMVNHATGTSKIPVPASIGTAFFAPRLEASRWSRLLVQPAKAIATLTNWNNATPSEKAAARLVARRSGEMIATYVALLAANQALLSAMGSKQKINFTNPFDPDWLKFKGANMTFDVSGGMVSVIDFLGRLASIAHANKNELKGKSKTALSLNTAGKYVVGKFSPFASTLYDFGVTHHDYMGNTLPLFNEKPENKYAHRMTWKEYITQEQMPIPISEAFTYVAQQMKDKGMSETQISYVLYGIVIGGLSGGTGTRISDDYKVTEKR